jgi:uncharacterized protein YkwD
MTLFRRVAAIMVCTMGLGSAALVSAEPTRALTAPRITRVEAAWATAVYALLNVERLAHGRLPLRLNQHLVKSAMYHNARMAKANTLSHQLAHELSFTDRELAFGYHWSTAAENCSVNPDVSRAGVLQLERMMIHERPPGETGHRQNILSRNYRDVGIAVLIDNTNQRVWMTEDFGAPA